MRLSEEDLVGLAHEASRAAREAGDLIATSRPSLVEHKETGWSPASQVVTEIDRNAEAIILAALAPSVERFDLGVLSEEQPDSGDRLQKAYFWCIDPLDGTLPFVEDRPGYSVSIALVAHDGTPVVGVVFDPLARTHYQAIVGRGLTRNERPWTPLVRRGGPLSVFLPRHLAGTEIVGALDVRARELGFDGAAILDQSGSVMNACQVLELEPAVFFKLPKPARGGGCLWDYAATACLFGEAGAIATDFQGATLELNRAESPYMNHRGVMFATDRAIAEALASLFQRD